MFERYYPALLGFLFTELKDPDTARDIAQETYARVLLFARGQGAIREPRALLYRTARNLMVDHHRRGRVHGLRQLEACDALPGADCDQPDNRLADQQEVARLLAAVETLPPRCREAFVLHKFDGLPQAEVARRMGITVNMVEKHIIRALLACRRISRQAPISPKAEPLPEAASGAGGMSRRR